MKILVLSDSHRCLGNMYDAVEKEMPQLVLHLGDHISDAEDLSNAFDALDFLYVPGNCDFAAQANPSILTECAEKRIFLTHGHLFGVKSGTARLLLEARRLGADIALFGHTHIPYCAQKPDGLWVMNPGACSASRASYGVIQIENGTITCALHRLD